MTQIHTCLNCSAEIRTGPFCEHCGQRNLHARLAFRDLLEDVKVQLLEWDLPWLYTIRAALLNPGKMCREYVDGKRKRYVNPLKYVLYLIPVILIVLNLLPNSYAVFPNVSLSEDEAPNYDHLPAVAAYLVGNPVILMMLLTPAIALMLRLVYTRDRHNNTEIVCWLLYAIGNGMLVAACIHLAFEFYLQHVLHVVQASQAYVFNYLPLKMLAIIAAVLAHTIFSAAGFFAEAWYLTWLKVLTITLASFGMFSLAVWGLEQTGEDAFQFRNSPRARLTSPLISNAPWIEEEQVRIARNDELNFGEFLRIVGRNNDALYHLLIADKELSDPTASRFVAAELAITYLNLGRHDFALTQLNRFDTPTLRLLALEAGLQRGIKEDLPDLIRETDILTDYNLQLAQLWSANETEAALDEIRRVTGTAGTPSNQLLMNARWAALLGDPELAWAIFLDQGDPRLLWQSIWMPYFSGVRQLPAFKDYVRAEGLENYWRTTGNWPDQCRPLGDSDFECF